MVITKLGTISVLLEVGRMACLSDNSTHLVMVESDTPYTTWFSWWLHSLIDWLSCLTWPNMWGTISVLLEVGRMACLSYNSTHLVMVESDTPYTTWFSWWLHSLIDWLSCLMWPNMWWLLPWQLKISLQAVCTLTWRLVD